MVEPKALHAMFRTHVQSLNLTPSAASEGCRASGPEVVEWVVRLISMGRGSKSIRRWRKDRKRKKAEREKRKLAAADQRRGSSRQRSG